MPEFGPATRALPISGSSSVACCPSGVATARTGMLFSRALIRCTTVAKPKSYWPLARPEMMAAMSVCGTISSWRPCEAKMPCCIPTNIGANCDAGLNATCTVVIPPSPDAPAPASEPPPPHAVTDSSAVAAAATAPLSR
jgi:hypothetical protein